MTVMQNFNISAVMIVFLVPWISGCRTERPPSLGDSVQASSLTAISVKAGRPMLFTHATTEGAFETVDAIDKVPADRRGWVRVVDLSQKPQARMDHELVYVADLRSPGKDGTFPYVVMSRLAFESAALARASLGATEPGPAPTAGTTRAASGGSGVVLYSTSWCSACRAAREYLTSQGVAFVEKDIETDQAAAQELLAKARAAGISPGGVPVIDVHGTLMQGFDAERLSALLGAQAGAAAKPQGAKP